MFKNILFTTKSSSKQKTVFKSNLDFREDRNDNGKGKQPLSIHLLHIAFEMCHILKGNSASMGHRLQLENEDVG